MSSATNSSAGAFSEDGEISLSVRLASSLDSYHELVQKILEQLEAFGWSKGDLFGIHMALEESITNAIRHGNKLDPSKQVEIECRMSPERFWIQIQDQGEGFDPQKVPDCRCADRLEVPGGRGLVLMQAYMSHVEYSDRGRRLTLEKVQGAPSCLDAAGCE